jgi:hypothetical protein
VLRTDTGNFNRFLSSLGLLLLLGALLIPYFYFHDTEVLRVPVSELEGLTPIAREALESRQQRTRDLETWVLVFSGVLAGGGIALLWFGGRRLRIAQKKEDAAIDRKARRDDFEIEQLSQAEVEEKREEQARESAAEGTSTEQPSPSGEIERSQIPLAGGVQATLSDSRVAVERIETGARTALEAESYHSYRFRYEVKTVTRTPTKRRELRLDGLFQSQERKRPDVILELKVVRRTRFIQPRLRNFADGVLALVARYGQISHRETIGWLVIVLPHESEPIELDERRQLEDRANDSLIGLGKATVVNESELQSLPRRFSRLFEFQAK